MSDPPRRVAVTGAAGYIGSGLIERLEKERQVERLLAIDIRPLSAPFGPKVAFLRQDVAAPLAQALSSHGTEAVVHLAYVLKPGRDREAMRRINVSGTANVLEACRDAGVSKVVYLSSTSVYGAHADNPPMLTEESIPRPVRGFQYSEDKAQAEALVQAFSERTLEVTTTILRCCPVLGPNADNFISRAFLKPFLVAVRGYDPPMQFVHEDDLIKVMVRCILDDAPGLYNVAGDGFVSWSEMAKMLGRRLLSLPAPLLYAAIDVAWALRLQSDSPSCGLDFIRHRWTASTDKIKRELGVEFRHTSREACEAFAQRQRGT